jgi:integrase
MDTPIVGTRGDLMPLPVVSFEVRDIGKRMARRRFQRGTLRTIIPAHGGDPARKLPRGTYWATWYRYVKRPDGSEIRRHREKIITRQLAEKHGIAKDYTGPLAKSDAQRVLDLLIAQDAGTYVPPDTAATVAMLGKEYLALSEPNWGPHMVRSAGSIVTKHIINGALGGCCIADVTESDLQSWINGYVNRGASRSLLKGLLLHARAIWKHARKKKIIAENPTEDLRARSKRRVAERYLTVEECRRLLSVLAGRDHLIVRMFIQLGLRPEEMFALRRDDVKGDQLRIDEALVEGESAPTKTEASDDYVYIPPDLAVELDGWMECSIGGPADWLFQTEHGRRGFMNANNYRNRILKPAAIRAAVGVIDTGKRDEKGKPILKTDVDFRALRRTCATLFGDRAKDPKSTQAQLRHADPTITLKHYQKAIPASVKAAAIALENDLTGDDSERVLSGSTIQ